MYFIEIQKLNFNAPEGPGFGNRYLMLYLILSYLASGSPKVVLF